jgi:hypothetical protein
MVNEGRLYGNNSGCPGSKASSSNVIQAVADLDARLAPFMKTIARPNQVAIPIMNMTGRSFANNSGPQHKANPPKVGQAAAELATYMQTQAQQKGDKFKTDKNDVNIKSKTGNEIGADFKVKAPPGKLGLTLKMGALVCSVEKSSPLESVINAGDVIVTINEDAVLTKNQFHSLLEPRVLGIQRHTTIKKKPDQHHNDCDESFTRSEDVEDMVVAYLHLQGEKLKAQKKSNVSSTELIPFARLQHFNSVAINLGIEYDNQHVGATPTSGLCKKYAYFIADEDNRVKIHDIEFILLHYDCRYGRTGMIKVMIGDKTLVHAPQVVTVFVNELINEKESSRSCEKSSMLVYLFSTIEMFYQDIQEERNSCSNKFSDHL